MKSRTRFYAASDESEDEMDRADRIAELVAGMEGWTPALVGLLANTDPAKRLQGRYVAAGMLVDRMRSEPVVSADQPALV